MKKLLIILFILPLLVQGQFNNRLFSVGTIKPGTVSVGGGSSVTIYDFKSATGTGGLSSVSFTGLPAGCFIVVGCVVETAGFNCTVSNTVATALTWAARGDASAANSGDVEIKSSTFTAGGNITISAQWNGSGYSAIGVWVLTGQETTFGGATVQGTAQTTPSQAITTTRANSLIIGAISDYNATDGTTRTIRDAAVEETTGGGGYYRSAANATFYFFHKFATAATSYTEGYSAPAAQKSGIALIEIRTP